MGRYHKIKIGRANSHSNDSEKAGASMKNVIRSCNFDEQGFLDTKHSHSLIKRSYPNIVEEDELPSIKMGTNCNIHIFHRRPIHPSTATLKGANSPDTSRAVKSKEIQKVPVHLLLDLKVKAQIDILQPCQEVLFLIHKGPSSLHQT